MTIQFIIRSPHVEKPDRYRVLTDKEVGREDRNRMPMVWVWSDYRVRLTKFWQWYLCAINYGMSHDAIVALLDTHKAFSNNTGFNDPGRPRANWIFMSNLDKELPLFDKTRTCGDAIVVYKNNIVTSMMDGNNPPPLKPGVAPPRVIAEATIDRYLYNPKDYPELFFACVNSVDGEPKPFRNGALYPWYKAGSTPVTFLPHVSSAPVVYPPTKWTDNTPTLVKV